MTQKLPPKLNAATHWMTSRQPLIPGESREALQAHLEHWNKLYPGVETDELLSDLVCEAAFSSWLLIRNQRQYDASLAILYQTDMDAWTPEQHKTYQLRERYLNAAHRRLNRHRSDILQYQSGLRAQAREDRAANHHTEAQPANEIVKEPVKKEPEPAPSGKRNDMIRQEVVVSVKDGKTTTFYHPDHDQILNNMATRRFETTLVARYLRFKDHIVPPEYEGFTKMAAKLKDNPTEENIVLLITIGSLRIAFEREKEFGGHLRFWPDLQAADNEIIQKYLKRGKLG
jgi:hypothetical protein